jgi:hypothetical protein
MFRRSALVQVIIIGFLGTASTPEIAAAAEGGFSWYGLGGAAFGAGQTPPPGTYLSFVGGYYAAEIEGAVTIGGELFELGLEVDFLQAAINGVYVPNGTSRWPAGHFRHHSERLYRS